MPETRSCLLSERYQIRRKPQPLSEPSGTTPLSAQNMMMRHDMLRSKYCQKKLSRLRKQTHGCECCSQIRLHELDSSSCIHPPQARRQIAWGTAVMRHKNNCSYGAEGAENFPDAQSPKNPPKKCLITAVFHNSSYFLQYPPPKVAESPLNATRRIKFVQPYSERGGFGSLGRNFLRWISARRAAKRGISTRMIAKGLVQTVSRMFRDDLCAMRVKRAQNFRGVS